MIYDIQPDPRHVHSREDFIIFATKLLQDLQDDPKGWENTTLERYLDALASITSSLEGRFKNRNQPMPEQPSWGLLAELLLVAAIYE